MPRYGLDTGFFFKLFDGDARARTVWNEIVAGDAEGIVSTITAYELSIHALKGVLVRGDVEALLEERSCFSVDDAQHAARIAWGNTLAMADVLILQRFLDAEVDCIVTTDRDLEQYEGGPDVEVL